MDTLGRRDLVASGYYDWMLCQIQEALTSFKRNDMGKKTEVLKAVTDSDSDGGSQFHRNI